MAELVSCWFPLLGDRGRIRGLNTGLKSSKAHCHNNAHPKLSCIPGHWGTISDGFRSTQKDQKVILACFKHMLDPYVEGTQPPLLAMKPRFHHAMPAVGDAVVVQGLPACQGFNGRRSRRGSGGAEAVAWWAYPPGYFMNLGHVFFFGGELWGRLWLWALRFQLWGLWCDHEFLCVAFCSSIAGEWMFIMFILPNMGIHMYTHVYTHNWFRYIPIDGFWSSVC